MKLPPRRPRKLLCPVCKFPFAAKKRGPIPETCGRRCALALALHRAYRRGASPVAAGSMLSAAAVTGRADCQQETCEIPTQACGPVSRLFLTFCPGSVAICVLACAASVGQDAEIALLSGLWTKVFRSRHGTIRQPAVRRALTMPWPPNNPSACTEIATEPLCSNKCETLVARPAEFGHFWHFPRPPPMLGVIATCELDILKLTAASLRHSRSYRQFLNLTAMTKPLILLSLASHSKRQHDNGAMRCIECDAADVSERLERTTQGYRRFRCRACGKQFNERSGGILNRAQYPSDVIALVIFFGGFATS